MYKWVYRQTESGRCFLISMVVVTTKGQKQRKRVLLLKAFNGWSGELCCKIQVSDRCFVSRNRLILPFIFQRQGRSTLLLRFLIQEPLPIHFFAILSLTSGASIRQNAYPWSLQGLSEDKFFLSEGLKECFSPRFKAFKVNRTARLRP
jgi:hypothetical protein